MKQSFFRLESLNMAPARKLSILARKFNFRLAMLEKGGGARNRAGITS
ncbi:hypothetical protein JNUCC23_21055 [Peribacillus sp. JNUCC 23]